MEGGWPLPDLTYLFRNSAAVHVPILNPGPVTDYL